MRFTKTPITKIVASASVAAVLGLTGVSVAGAASTDSPSKPATTAPAPAAGKATAKAKHAALRRHLRRRAGVLAAKTIGIKPAELRTELLAGKTIATIATEHGVQPQTVIDKLVAAANARIDAAVKANKITAERAAKLKARVATAIPKIVNTWHPKAKA